MKKSKSERQKERQRYEGGGERNGVSKEQE